MNPVPLRERGFTLVEVLVAMVVMAIMSLLAWQGVDGIVRSRDSNQTRLERTLRLETVIAQWEQDLAALQETNAVPALTCDGLTVRMTRRTEGGMQVVAWALRPDNGGAIWQRWASPPATTTRQLQDSWLRTQQFQGNESGQLKALVGLDEWRVYFFQGNAWSNCQSTGNVVTPVTNASTALSVVAAASAAASGATASAAAVAAAAATVAGTQRTALPAGVRLVLAFAPGSGLNGSIVRDSLIAP
jgi:general secretion pathway protein J